jgi:hypothetical protein
VEDWPTDKVFQVSARFTKASSLKNDLSDSKTLADEFIQPNSTGYDISAKAVINLSGTVITQRFDNLSFDECDIPADFVVLRPESSPQGISIAIESYAWSGVHLSPSDDRESFRWRRINRLNPTVHMTDYSDSARPTSRW